MAEYTNREHYIPVRVSDLVTLLCTDKNVQPEDAESFRQFARLVAATFHFEYHQKLQDLKDGYAPFDPDTVTREVRPLSAQEKETRLGGLFDQFTWLLERANYKRLDRTAIEAAMQEVSAWGINMEVDFDVFERLEVFVRGDSMGRRYIRSWWQFWKKPAEVQVPVYQRLALILKLRPHKRLPEGIDTKGVYLKLFKDMPKADIEMLLPGAQLKMPGLARLKLGSSLLSGLAWILYTTVRTLLAAAAFSIWALYGPIAALAGYGYKQWYGYQFAKTTYGLQLTQSLYYQNLDNNAGVLTQLLDEAEEQECREALLGYYYLWRHAGERGWTAKDLDDYVEMDLERLLNLKVDFEIEDALAKLERLGVVEKTEDRYRAVPLARALEALDSAWDNYFKYANPDAAKAAHA